MSLDYATIKAAIKTWVEGQSGLVAQWRDESGAWHTKPRILLHLKDIGAVGQDYVTWAQDTDLDPGADFVPTVSGNRQLVLTLYVETRNQSGNNTAAYYLEVLRSSTKKPAVRSVLYDAGIVIRRSEEIHDISNWVDDRLESKASLDIHLSAVVNVRDEGEADSFVGTVETTAVLTTPAADDKGWEDVVMP